VASKQLLSIAYFGLAVKKIGALWYLTLGVYLYIKKNTYVKDASFLVLLSINKIGKYLFFRRVKK
jgi:hypothetical protein